MTTRIPALLLAAPLLAGCPTEEPLTPCAGERTETWDGAALTLHTPDCASMVLTARVLGEGDLSVDFVQRDGAWAPTVTAEADGTFTGLVLEGAWEVAGAEPAVLWRQGYQSWGVSGGILYYIGIH